MNTCKLVLVDGSSYLYRAFHALPPLSNSRGEPTGAVLGVINMLNKLIKEEAPERIAVVFDAPGRTFRDDLFEQYKAHRPSMPDELRAQVQPLLDAVAGMGLPLLRIGGVEADDVIGTLARRGVAAGCQVLISTGDKDMAQLVEPGIDIVNTMSNTRLDRDGVKAKFDVYPEQMIDYLALVGDSSDNIPGINGVGPKTAAKWLKQYQTLDNLIAHAAEITGKVGENLRAELAVLELSRQLATIKTDVALEIEPLALTPAPPDVAKLREIYSRLELRMLLRTLEAGAGTGAGETFTAGADAPRSGAGLASNTGDAGGSGTGGGTALAGVAGGRGALAGGAATSANGAPGSAGGAAAGTAPVAGGADAAPAAAGFTAVAGVAPAGAPTPPERRYECITEQAQLEEWLERLRAAPLFAFDTETDSLDYMQARIVGVSFAAEPGHAAYVPLAHDYPGAPPQLGREAVLAALKPLLEDARHAKLGHHLKYDMHVLANYGIALAGQTHDSMLESYVLNSVGTRHDMDSTALRYLGVNTIHFEDVAGKGAKQLTFNQVEVPRAAEYSAEDADVTLQLHRMLWPQICATPKLQQIYETIEQPLVPVLFRMERSGVLVDREQLKKQSGELANRMLELEQAAHVQAGGAFNLDSPRQLQQILFERLQIPVTRKTPTGQPSTAEDVLEELAASYPLPKLILEYRGIAKLKSTYTDKLPLEIDQATGRIHTSYHQATAATGRLSSTDPNLQNIPIRTQEGRRIRQAFVAPPGRTLVAADYSQIELRIMAHLSGDEGLLRAFEQDLDVHQATAAEVFGVPLEAVSADQRRSAKAINFGLIYGMSAFGLARQLGIARGQAQIYVDLYFQRYPGVRRYMEETRRLAHEQGYVETVFGRRLYLPDINSRNQSMRQYAERSAINAPMQGTAADIIKRAMIDVDDWLQSQRIPACLIMQVHDELVVEADDGVVPRIVEELHMRMARAADLRVPLKVEVGTGRNWDEAH